jgi:hypothetical protein
MLGYQKSSWKSEKIRPFTDHQRYQVILLLGVRGKYCDFHEQADHYTKGCIALKLLIEELIKNDKLNQFLGEQRNQSGNNRPQNLRDYQPQDQQPLDYYHQDRP